MDSRAKIAGTGPVDVLIYQDGLPVQCCRSQQFGFTGMVLATDPTPFGVGTRLEVECRPGSGSSPAMVRLAARVVRATEQGLELVFLRVGPEAFRIIGEWRRAAAPAVAALTP